MVLLTQLMLFILFVGVFQVVSLAAGWNEALVLTDNSPAAERWQARMQLGLGHFLSFAVAGFFTVWLFYRDIAGVGRDWRDYLQVRRLPRLNIAALAVLLMAVSIPLVLFTLNINQLIPLPQELKAAEDQTEALIKGVLRMDSVLELLGNLLIIALLPAIGEEIVFRGVVQRQLMRRIANPWVALFISAAVFSFIHLQFEGFLPRLLLGFLLGWLYWTTQNFWIPALAHFFNNGLQVVGQYLYGKEVSSVDLEKDIQVPWFAAAISALMVWIVMRFIRTATNDFQSPDSD
jgi:membrane protease YdiL (CAAX protease family)